MRVKVETRQSADRKHHKHTPHSHHMHAPAGRNVGDSGRARDRGRGARKRSRGLAATAQIPMYTCISICAYIHIMTLQLKYQRSHDYKSKRTNRPQPQSPRASLLIHRDTPEGGSVGIVGRSAGRGEGGIELDGRAMARGIGLRLVGARLGLLGVL